jgi:Flp pilus assembly pilin Flp
MSKSSITVRNQEGQTMAEYAVVLAVITIAIVTSFSLLSGAIEAAFDSAAALVRSVV